MDLLTLKEAARLCGVTPLTVKHWIQKGHIRFVRHTPRSPFLIPREEVERLRTPKRT